MQIYVVVPSAYKIKMAAVSSETQVRSLFVWFLIYFLVRNYFHSSWLIIRLFVIRWRTVVRPIMHWSPSTLTL